jgi:hypothetical protein
MLLSAQSPARTAIKLASALVFFCLVSVTRAIAQDGVIPSVAVLQSATEDPKQKKHKTDEQKSGPQPNTVIPVIPLGFAPPAITYLGDRIAQVSLDFIDEDTLLFTFRVPGLIPRESPAESAYLSGIPNDGSHRIRNIRAVVLSLPTGHVAAESLWRVHDFAPYLWMLKDHHFLFRDRDTVEMGDADLRLTPFLRFPGYLRSLELDPSQQMLVANSTEMPAPSASPAPAPATQPDASSAPPTRLTSNADSDTALASLNPTSPTSQSGNALDQPNTSPTPAPPAPQDLVRILNMNTLHVQLLGRSSGHLPIDGQGYFDALRGRASNWDIVYVGFDGSITPLLQMDSTCFPSLDIPASGIVLVSACTAAGARKLTAIDRAWGQAGAGAELAAVGPTPDPNRARMWEATLPITSVWPHAAHATGGLRVARETLEVTRIMGLFSPLDGPDIRSQNVEVYDLADGRVPIKVSITPILDNGGNFALSPSGNRFAVLNAGQIQVYDLPPAPPIPAAPPPKPAPPPAKH